MPSVPNFLTFAFWKMVNLVEDNASLIIFNHLYCIQYLMVTLQAYEWPILHLKTAPLSSFVSLTTILYPQVKFKNNFLPIIISGQSIWLVFTRLTNFDKNNPMYKPGNFSVFLCQKLQCVSTFNHFPLKGCGMGPWLVLVSPCFRENVVW